MRNPSKHPIRRHARKSTRKRFRLPVNGIERLERRELLAADSINLTEQFDAQRLAAEEFVRLGPKNEADVPNFVDAGDSYWAGEREVQLFRRTDQFLVGGEADADAAQLGRDLSAAPETISEFNVELSPTESSYVVTSDSVGGEDEVGRVVRQLDELNSVQWASPAFVTADGASILIEQEIVVALADGVDPQGFFETEYQAFERISGTPNQYVATVDGGSLEVLDLNQVKTDLQMSLKNSKTLCVDRVY